MVPVVIGPWRAQEALLRVNPSQLLQTRVKWPEGAGVPAAQRFLDGASALDRPLSFVAGLQCHAENT